MKIVFSNQISKKEQISIIDQKNIIKAFSKGIFLKIKGDSLPKFSQLVKIYMTTVSGAKRTVFLVDTKSNDSFFLFYRSKKDKIGENISIKNPIFKKSLIKYLSILKKDLQNKSYQYFEIKL